MGRKSTIHEYLGKTIGGVVLIKEAGFSKRDGRKLVECKCENCGKNFIATFHNVYRGNYKSCGCLQHATSINNPKWMGHGEIGKTFFIRLRHGAEARNLEFKIKIEDIWELFLKQNRKCALSGESLTLPKTASDSESNASLDRIDANKGYIKGNLQWVTKEINIMKQKMNNEYFLKLINKINEYNK